MNWMNKLLFVYCLQYLSPEEGEGQSIVRRADSRERGLGTARNCLRLPPVPFLIGAVAQLGYGLIAC